MIGEFAGEALATIFGPNLIAGGLRAAARTEAAANIIAQTTAFADKTLKAIELLATGTTRARGIPASNIYKVLKAWNENGHILEIIELIEPGISTTLSQIPGASKIAAQGACTELRLITSLPTELQATGSALIETAKNINARTAEITGTAPCATAEGIARELNRPLPDCGTGASQALPNFPDIECGTAAGIVSSEPREQGCLIDNHTADIPACGTGLVEERAPAPLPCNWSRGSQHLPGLRSIEAEPDLKKPLEKEPIKVIQIGERRKEHVEFPMPLEQIQKILDNIDDANNNLVNNAEIKKILESAPEVMKQFIEKALQKCPQLTREQLERMVIKLVNTEHIFGFDRRIFQTPDGKLYIKVEGFHLDHGNALEKSGLIKIINRVPLEDGAYRADIMINNIIVKRGTTFFPAHWTPAQVIQKVLESLNNPIEIRVQGKWIKIRGITVDNLEIHTSITDIGSIYTTMPAKDGKNHE